MQSPLLRTEKLGDKRPNSVSAGRRGEGTKKTSPTYDIFQNSQIKTMLYTMKLSG